MRQRQSRRVKTRAIKAREGRVAAYLRALDNKNARKPRRSLRITLNWEVAPSQVILFGEKGFFLDDVAARGPPQVDYRIRGNDSTDEEDNSTVKKNGVESISSNKATTLGGTRAESSSNRDTDNEDDKLGSQRPLALPISGRVPGRGLGSGVG